jgi:hypothetical protein
MGYAVDRCCGYDHLEDYDVQNQYIYIFGGFLFYCDGKKISKDFKKSCCQVDSVPSANIVQSAMPAVDRTVF